MKTMMESSTADREMARKTVATFAGGTAQASLVNRTHRIVRERAQQMKARRKRIRSLWAPLAVCGSMLVILVSAVWTMLDEYELTPTGMPDASDQYFVLLFWFLPATAALLAMFWLRRAQNRRSQGEMAQ
ncbi:MAG TPA: hypothetical protein VL495_07285 [Edaphobacter sp.]|jgi:hypothetical protein|nr:hypothetical protein [Edaphobacter sp.]